MVTLSPLFNCKEVASLFPRIIVFSSLKLVNTLTLILFSNKAFSFKSFIDRPLTTTPLDCFLLEIITVDSTKETTSNTSSKINNIFSILLALILSELLLT